MIELWIERLEHIASRVAKGQPRGSHEHVKSRNRAEQQQRD
jgi:hypothetical protein